MKRTDEQRKCSTCGQVLEIWPMYGELKGICKNPECDEVVELGADPEW